MKAYELKKLLGAVPDDYDILIDGEEPGQKITVDYKFCYVFMKSKHAEDVDNNEDI